jgi:hypothetical protein
MSYGEALSFFCLPQKKVVWYAFLGMASKEQKPKLKFDLTYFAQNAGVDKIQS